MSVVTEVSLILLVAATTVYAFFWVQAKGLAAAPALTVPPEPMAFLFEDGVLHHGTDEALAAFALWPGQHIWEDLRDTLLPRFPEFPKEPNRSGMGHVAFPALDPADPSQLNIRWRSDLCWVEIGAAADDRMSIDVSPKETPDHLCADTMPGIAWVTCIEGTVSWTNAAYDALVGRLDQDSVEILIGLNTAGPPQRHEMVGQDGTGLWLSITSHQIEAGTIHHASDITALVRSEAAQRSFMQTFAKTFAHLQVGLAIFDAGGQLRIFNPALVELTKLEPRVLATQPTMLTFFDLLRENRCMPEPKNYGSWRQKITGIISEASNGLYHETWTLEDGRTYAVEGRPHPEGATAFSVEDISSEITLARNFRKELEQSADILDHIEDAIAVFSNAGILTLCNAAYKALWKQDPEASFADVTLHDAQRLWLAQCKPGTSTDRLDAFISAIASRERVSAEVMLNAGDPLVCRTAPLSVDATLVQFSNAHGTVDRSTIHLSDVQV